MIPYIIDFHQLFPILSKATIGANYIKLLTRYLVLPRIVTLLVSIIYPF